MIVRLTTGQFNACLEVAEGQLAVDLERGRTEHSTAKVDVVMPYVAWLACQDRLMDLVFTPKGYRDREAPGRFLMALKNVTTGINWWELLPPLRNAAMIGWQALVVPAWDATGTPWQNPRRPWSPLPIPDRPMSVLKPEWIRQGQLRLTRWSPEQGVAPNGDWATSEEAFRPYHDVARRHLDLAVFVKGAPHLGDEH